MGSSRVRTDRRSSWPTGPTRREAASEDVKIEGLGRLGFLGSLPPGNGGLTAITNIEAGSGPTTVEPTREMRATIHINMDSIPGRLQVRLQWFINMVAFGLQASSSFESPRLALPDARITMQLSGDADAWDLAQVRKAFANWMLACGLRELVEEFSGSLAQSREFLAAWALGSGQITGEDWNKRMVTEAQRFHKLGFPDKVEFLKDEYGVELPQDKHEDLLSINRARNCLVHRGGIVGLPDIPVTKDELSEVLQARRDREPTEKWSSQQVVSALREAGLQSALVLTWQRMELYTEKDGKERVLDPRGDADARRVEAGALVGLRVVKQTHAFEYGQVIRLSADDFCEIAYALLNTAFALRDAVEARGRAMGATFQGKVAPDAG